MPSTAQKDALAALYLCMARIRAFENAAEILSQGGVSAYNKTADGSAKVRGPLHLSTGQEGVAAGVCAHLTREDLLTSTHRGHGHCIAKGVDPVGMMASFVFVPINAVPTSCTEPSPPTAHTISIFSTED